jgi:riboflavin kinase/FMN adenylyltransferase
MNIGRRPTVDGSRETYEVHLFDFAADLYDQSLAVDLIARLRDEQKFDGLPALQAQIRADCAEARAVLAAGVSP